MSRRDQLDELDQKIAATFQSAAEELRQELVERLQDTRDKLHRLVQETARRGRDEPAAAGAPGDLTNLRSATSALVAAATQEEILDRLLRGATSFCDRAVLFLVDSSSIRLWAALGLNADAESLTLSLGESVPWTRLMRHQGAIRLSADDCGQALGGVVDTPPHGGVLIPMALADRLVGALYADAPTRPSELPVEPLQLLVQSASQCLESLSLRPHRIPISLRIATETTEPVTRLDLWAGPSAKDEAREEEE